MATTSQQEQEKSENDGSLFECNICLDTAKDAVVSYCGHLFCWPCLHQWLEMKPAKKICPVCKSAIDRDKVIPLYGRGSTKQKDPRESVPPRPPGQRTEPENTGTFGGFPGFGDGSFHLSFGIGAFPFGFVTSSFNLGDNRPGSPVRGSHQFEQENLLSNFFLFVAFVFLIMLLFA